MSASASSRCSVETYSSPSFLRLVLGAVEDLVELARERRLRVATASGSAPISRSTLLAQRGDVDAELLEDRDDDALVLVEQRERRWRS